ncbi:MAG: hypothetical protein ACYCSA_05025 [Thermoplasmataceae archaeon]
MFRHFEGIVNAVQVSDRWIIAHLNSLSMDRSNQPSINGFLSYRIDEDPIFRRTSTFSTLWRRMEYLQ